MGTIQKEKPKTKKDDYSIMRTKRRGQDPSFGWWGVRVGPPRASKRLKIFEALGGRTLISHASDRSLLTALLRVHDAAIAVVLFPIL